MLDGFIILSKEPLLYFLIGTIYSPIIFYQTYTNNRKKLNFQIRYDEFKKKIRNKLFDHELINDFMGILFTLALFLYFMETSILLQLILNSIILTREVYLKN